MDEFLTRGSTGEQVDRMIELMGEFLINNFNTDTMLVSGSIVLDALNGTNFAKDIDLFCTAPAAKTLLKKAEDAGYVCESRESSSTNFYPEVLQCYRLTRGDEERQIDVVVTKGHPFDSIAQFDLSHNKVAFDGDDFYQHTDVNDRFETKMAYKKGTIEAITTFLLDFEPPKKKYKRTMFKQAEETFQAQVVNSMIRAGKYYRRGYVVLDKKGVPIRFTPKLLERLDQLAREKPPPVYESV